jgi:YVTN family beta-propeller protein
VNTNSNIVSVIDIATDKVTSSVNVGPIPVSVTIAPDGKKAYVMNFLNNTVSVIDTNSNTIRSTVCVGNGHCDLNLECCQDD